MSDVHQPVAALLAGLGNVIDVAALTALAPGGVHNTLPQDPQYPCVELRVRAKPIGGIASSAVWEADAEIWICSTYRGDREALQIAEVVAGLVDRQPIVAEGWTVIECALLELFYAGDEEIDGVTVKEWVLPLRLHVERA